MTSSLPGEAPLRRVRLFRGYGALVVAVVLGAVLWLAPVQSPSPAVYAIVVSSIAVFGVQQLWQARRTVRDAVAKLPPALDPNSLPIDDRLRLFRRQLLIGAIVSPLLSVITAVELQRLESCDGGRVTIWAPLAFLYEYFGYWPAVLAPLVVGGTISTLLIARLRRGE